MQYSAVLEKWGCVKSGCDLKRLARLDQLRVSLNFQPNKNELYRTERYFKPVLDR